MSITNLAPTSLYQAAEYEDRFSRLASDEDLRRTARALTERGMQATVAASGEAAKEEALKLIPHGAQVFTASSRTLVQLGLVETLNESGEYESIRKRFKSKDRSQLWSEMRRAASSPDVVVGSVQAITLDGVVMDVSASGSQLPAYAAGAEKVIWIVGAQKIVMDMDEGMRRIYEYCLPLENRRAMEAYGVLSDVNKILIVNREPKPGRISVILVKQNLGF